MITKSEAREKFGELVKSSRSKLGLDRGKFARLVGVEREVIVRLEHGVPNPTRPELVRAIKMLKLGEKEMNRAYELLRIFSPRRNQAVKFHLHISVLRHRNRSHNYFKVA